MKKLYLSMIAALISAGLNAADVTFNVDMNGQTVSANGVHVAGSFQSEAGFAGDWDPATTALTDNGNGVWSVTLTIPAGYYEYKFVNGSSWGNDETPGTACNVNGNRAVSVGTANLSVATTAFGQCASGGSTVVFQVSMKNQSFINPNGIHVAGSFQAAAGASGDWKPDETRLYDMDGDSIYKYAATLPSASYEYKFLNGNQWGDDETVPAACASNNNRPFTNDAAKSLVLPAVGFGACPPGVIFRVDMSDETVSANGVHIAGGFQGWDPAATAMTDIDADKVYEATIQMAPGTYEYKFINGNDWPDAETVPAQCATNGNRTISVTGGTVAPIVKFGKCRPVLTLSIDMSNETVSADGIHVAGAFQGWDPSGTQLMDMGNGIYEVSLPVDGGTYEYKFVNGKAWGGDESVPGACNTNGNRTVTVGSSDFSAPLVCFKQCGHPCTVDPDPADITFRVDMALETVDSTGVWLMGTITATQWQPGAVKMTDADNDKVYEATVNVKGAAEIQFKFANGDPKTASFQDGETADFDSLGCGISNGIGLFNRTHTRSGVAETLDIVSYNNCSRINTGISKLGIGQFITVFPNPANNVVHIQYTEDNSFEVVLMDLSGKVITRSNEVIGQTDINLSGLSTGAYIVMIYDKKLNQAAYQKLIIE